MKLTSPTISIFHFRELCPDHMEHNTTSEAAAVLYLHPVLTEQPITSNSHLSRLHDENIHYHNRWIIIGGNASLFLGGVKMETARTQ